ncbi:MAG: hypothetical protein CVU40_10690 [Chloroflexi bacterium HGW-Chloroflexi-2]|nr:MAG: hypothetical protein CVU40_10690 [Chloroflexi bacterium HGW-Chloroflexi-2]
MIYAQIKLATNLQQDNDLMEKTNHLDGHCKNMKDLLDSVRQQCWEEFALNLSNFHDKINLGKLVELPREFQIKIHPSEVIQELQTLYHKALGKIHFSQPVTLNLLF